MSKIAVVMPSIRPDMVAPFLKEWQPLFHKHKVEFILVVDGKNQ